MSERVQSPSDPLSAGDEAIFSESSTQGGWIKTVVWMESAIDMVYPRWLMTKLTRCQVPT